MHASEHATCAFRIYDNQCLPYITQQLPALSGRKCYDRFAMRVVVPQYLLYSKTIYVNTVQRSLLHITVVLFNT